MKVILAVDGSPNAEDAVEFTVRYSWSDDTEMCVPTVVENIPPRSVAIWHGMHGVLEEMRREETARAGGFVAQVAERLQQSGVTTETMVRHGDPRTLIINE